MKKGIRTAVYDTALQLEVFRFQGIAQPFPSHFHAYYVIGIIEKGRRSLSCRSTVYSLRPGNIVLFPTVAVPLKRTHQNAGRKSKRPVGSWNSILRSTSI